VEVLVVVVVVVVMCPVARWVWVPGLARWR
jgi:type II secretory pathway pseudopilin PulG